jgi:hypothetical protein
MLEWVVVDYFLIFSNVENSTLVSLFVPKHLSPRKNYAGFICNFLHKICKNSRLGIKNIICNNNFFKLGLKIRNVDANGH